MIKNIVFDMGGVLIHYDPAALAARLRLPPEDEKLMLREAFGSVEWIQMDRGVLSQEEGAAAIRRRLPERLHPALERAVNWWELELRPVEGMEALLRELKELGYGVYLLSNATVRQPEYFRRIPGSQYFDGRIVSAFYRLLKPQHEIYELLLREFSLRAEECFFVDDSAANVESAIHCGFSGVVFDGDVPRLRREMNKAGAAVKMEP